MDITFEVLGKPQGKARVKVTQRNGFALAYTPDKTTNYENLIKLCYMNCRLQEDLTREPISMTIRADYEIPKSFSKKKQIEALSGKLRPTTKPDLDNIAKIVCDALNKVAYYDDNQVIELHVSKFYSKQPKLVIHLKEVKDEN